MKSPSFGRDSQEHFSSSEETEFDLFQSQRHIFCPSENKKVTQVTQYINKNFLLIFCSRNKHSCRSDGPDTNTNRDCHKDDSD